VEHAPDAGSGESGYGDRVVGCRFRAGLLSGGSELDGSCSVDATAGEVEDGKGWAEREGFVRERKLINAADA
jgi:hypothetical protein